MTNIYFQLFVGWSNYKIRRRTRRRRQLLVNSAAGVIVTNCYYGFPSGATRTITNVKALWRQLELSNNFGQMEFDCLLLPTATMNGSS